MTEHEDALFAAMEAHYARWRGSYQLSGRDADTAARWALARTLNIEGQHLALCVELDRVPWKLSDGPSKGDRG
jgi:hypothetical protein